jgi:phosphoesterase RecJ-like protein
MRLQMTTSEAAKYLSERDNILLLTHTRPDGDTLCSAAGLAQAMRENGKSVYLLRNPEATERYTQWMGDCWASEGFLPEHVITIDVASDSMLQLNTGDYKDKIELAIDHHGSNTGFAPNSCIIPERASCGEVVYDIIAKMYGTVSAETAKLLYIALSTDCGCFAYGNADSNAHFVASKLAEAGAPLPEINKFFFRTKSKKRVQLESRIISTMDFSRDGAVAIAKLPLSLVAELELKEDDMDDIASLPGQIEGVVVGATIKEKKGGGTKVSVRTTPLADANLICAEFGGGGHKMAAGCTADYDIDEMTERLKAAIDKVWAK